MLTTILCGLAPALYAARGELYLRLQGSAKGANAGFQHGGFRSGLVVAEVAMAIVMLAGAGLMMRTFFALESVDLGFDPAKVLVASLARSPGRQITTEQENVFIRQILQRVTALPGVIAATPTWSYVPFVGGAGKVVVQGKTYPRPLTAMQQVGSEGWFQTLGLHLFRGRLFSENDVDLSRHVAVVNQTFARQFFGQDDPIGQKIKFNPEKPQEPYFEIIGVVGDAPNKGIEEQPMAEAIYPYSTFVSGGHLPGLLVRTSGDALRFCRRFKVRSGRSIRWWRCGMSNCRFSIADCRLNSGRMPCWVLQSAIRDRQFVVGRDGALPSRPPGRA